MSRRQLLVGRREERTSFCNFKSIVTDGRAYASEILLQTCRLPEISAFLSCSESTSVVPHLTLHEQILLLEISLSHRYRAQEAQYLSKSRVHVLFISGTLFGRTFYFVVDWPWPNHMDDSGLVSSTMSPPLGATKHGRTLVQRLLGGYSGKLLANVAAGPGPPVCMC